jgi:hypothetical protein
MILETISEGIRARIRRKKKRNILIGMVEKKEVGRISFSGEIFLNYVLLDCL